MTVETRAATARAQEEKHSDTARAPLQPVDGNTSAPAEDPAEIPQKTKAEARTKTGAGSGEKRDTQERWFSPAVKTADALSKPFGFEPRSGQNSLGISRESMARRRLVSYRGGPPDDNTGDRR